MAPDKTGLRGKAFSKRRATPPVTAGRKCCHGTPKRKEDEIKRATKTSPAASEAPDDPASETDAFDASQPSQAHGQEAQVEQRPRSKGKKGSKEKPPTKGGRPVGVQGYSESDTMALLTLIDQDLPRGGNEWDRVRDQYNVQHALVEGRDTRTTDSLKSRFRHVLAPAAPSGKTRFSALRTMAVEIQQRIMNKVHNVTVDDSQSLEERSDNDEYDQNSASEHDEDSEKPEQREFIVLNSGVGSS
ncbi:hypothetical protein F442_03024 [Phytophthora nicotianae P10297]|uniref:DUF6818 domain-containing protein n=1 Tax=Phytophthora nicotianae P10297 TaxID=1317064 RepID=W2ZY62_PHYNI|nr:hypothetical protein F442_03024 [Phytophthora nicotianae P10297]